jgi:hypothetical protein
MVGQLTCLRALDTKYLLSGLVVSAFPSNLAKFALNSLFTLVSSYKGGRGKAARQGDWGNEGEGGK